MRRWWRLKIVSNSSGRATDERMMSASLGSTSGASPRAASSSRRWRGSSTWGPTSRAGLAVDAGEEVGGGADEGADRGDDGQVGAGALGAAGRVQRQRPRHAAGGPDRVERGVVAVELEAHRDAGGRGEHDLDLGRALAVGRRQ